jgi:hypothetical protein
MTDTFKLRNNQMNPTIYCHSSYYYDCFIFPEINYIIIHASRDDYYVYMDVTIGNAISQYATTLVGRVWQNGRFMGFDQLTIATSNWN